MKKFSGANNLNGQFVDRDPNSGLKGTTPNADWLNSLQEELCSVVTADGVQLSSVNGAQIFERVTARKKLIADTTYIPTPDVYLPFDGTCRLVYGKSTALETTDNNGTPVITPVLGARYSLPSIVYEYDNFIQGIYPINVARYSNRGIKLLKTSSNLLTQSWDMVNYVRGTNPNLREPTVRTMFGRSGTRVTKTDTSYLYILGVFGRKIILPDSEYTYAICYNLDFAAENKIRFVRSRLAYSANWNQIAQIEVDLETRQVVRSFKALRYELKVVDNFLIISATGRSSSTPEATGGGSIDIMPITEAGAAENGTATGVAELMWCQLERSSFFDSYIETTGQEVTRASEVLTVAGENFDVNSPNGITFKCKFTINTNDTSTAQYLFDIGNATTNRLGVYVQNGMLSITAGASGRYHNVAAILKIYDENILAVSIKNGETVKFVLNGVPVEITTGAFISTIVPNVDMRIGASSSGNHKNSMYIRDWTWWNKAFNMDQLRGVAK